MESDEVPATVLAVVAAVLGPQALQYTQPVLRRSTGEQPELLGSALIVSAGAGMFAFTASHLINQAGDAELLIGDGKQLHSLRGRRWRVATEFADPGSDADRIDVAIIRLDDDVARVVNEEVAIPLTSIEFDAEPDRRNPVLLLGYPCSKHEDAMRGDSFEAESYTLMAFELDKDEYQQACIDRSLHLGVDFDRKDVWAPGGRRTAPSLNGMSGGGIWRMAVYGSEPASSIRLAAIFVEHFQKTRVKHVRATRMTTLLYFLAKADSEVEAALGKLGVRVA